MGVKRDSKVSVLGVADEKFWADLKKRTYNIQKKPSPDADLIFYQAEEQEALRRITHLKDYIKTNGAIWVVTPKGKKEINQTDVIEAAKTAGLVDVKVVSFSENLTALKLVIPLANRQKDPIN